MTNQMTKKVMPPPTAFPMSRSHLRLTTLTRNEKKPQTKLRTSTSSIFFLSFLSSLHTTRSSKPHLRLVARLFVNCSVRFSSLSRSLLYLRLRFASSGCHLDTYLVFFFGRRSEKSFLPFPAQRNLASFFVFAKSYQPQLNSLHFTLHFTLLIKSQNQIRSHSHQTYLSPKNLKYGFPIWTWRPCRPWLLQL